MRIYYIFILLLIPIFSHAEDFYFSSHIEAFGSAVSKDIKSHDYDTCFNYYTDKKGDRYLYPSQEGVWSETCVSVYSSLGIEPDIYNSDLIILFGFTGVMSASLFGFAVMKGM